jgi:acyl-CoA thioester hydrolase
MSGEFNWQVRVYYEDTDAAGIVFYANYLRYMERARTEWLRSVGYEHALLKDEHGILFAVKDLSIKYIKPARLDELLTVSSSLLTKRGASLIFQQTIKNEHNEILIQADVKVACLNALTLKASAMPEALLTELANDT